MKYAFSTLGCPRWTWQEVVTTAKDLGYDGIEVRGIGREMYVPKEKIFSDDNINKTISDLRDVGIEIPCLTSGALLYDKENHSNVMIEAMKYIDLASKLQTPYVRVLGDRNPEAGEDIDDDFVIKTLDYLSSYADGLFVTLLVETNGVYADTSRLFKLMTKLNRDNVGVLWDVHHPYRFFNESISHTYNILKDYIKYVHLKDSVVVDGKVQYKMVGQGDIPVLEVIELLNSEHYNGYVSLEWVKRWNMGLEEPGIVFPSFINYLKKIIML